MFNRLTTKLSLFLLDCEIVSFALQLFYKTMKFVLEVTCFLVLRF
jgi:hypothetical protein